MLEPRLALGRYRLAETLGAGGWCTVCRGEDTVTGQAVAVKTFTAQAVSELGEAGLLARFTHEVRVFQALGLGPGDPSAGSGRRLLVNLLDFSRDAAGAPGPAEDGQCYTVLELAGESLEGWLRRRGAGPSLAELRGVASALAHGLAWLHTKGFCHLDVKPENIMRFLGAGDSSVDGWKLIDLEGCLPTDGSMVVKQDSFTPLYASPELASFALGEADGAPVPNGAMDVWAAGVVLLDVLARGTALEETKSGFDTAALFEEEAVPCESWYRWLSSPEPLVPADFVDVGTPGAALLESDDVSGFLKGLLEKDPTRRPAATKVLESQLLRAETQARATEASPGHTALETRNVVEAAFKRWDEATGSCGEMARELILLLLARLGLCSAEAEVILGALDPLGKPFLPYSVFLDFIFEA